MERRRISGFPATITLLFKPEILRLRSGLSPHFVQDDAGGTLFTQDNKRGHFDISWEVWQPLESFVEMFIFNVIIGNCGAHLKNYSIVHGQNWSEFHLAPAYDLASTVVYEGLQVVQNPRGFVRKRKGFYGAFDKHSRTGGVLVY